MVTVEEQQMSQLLAELVNLDAFPRGVRGVTTQDLENA